jgi:hypothetical protein
VSVEGVTKAGRRIAGANTLKLAMGSGVSLTKAEATGYTTGVAAARGLPPDAFSKVRCAAGGAGWRCARKQPL